MSKSRLVCMIICPACGVIQVQASAKSKYRCALCDFVMELEFSEDA